MKKILLLTFISLAFACGNQETEPKEEVSQLEETSII